MISVREREGGEGEKQTIKRLKHYCFHVTTPILYSTWETNKQVQQDPPLSNFLFFHVFFLFHDINGHHKGCWPQNSHSSTFTSVKYRKRGELVKPKHSLIFQLIKQNLEKNKKGNKAHKKVHPIKQQLEKYKNTEYQTRKIMH